MTDTAMNHMKISVKHKIGAEVKHQWNDLTYKVIGYQFITPDTIRYICIQPDKTDWVYFAECELKPSESLPSIGFYTGQDPNDNQINPNHTPARTHRKNGTKEAGEI